MNLKPHCVFARTPRIPIWKNRHFFRHSWNGEARWGRNQITEVMRNAWSRPKLRTKPGWILAAATGGQECPPHTNQSFRARMGLVVHVHDMLDRELRVPLGRRQTLMAQQFLDGAQVRAFFQHVGTKSMAESMWVHVGGKAFGDGDALDDTSHAAGSEAAATLVDE